MCGLKKAFGMLIHNTGGFTEWIVFFDCTLVLQWSHLSTHWLFCLKLMFSYHEMMRYEDT